MDCRSGQELHEGDTIPMGNDDGRKIVKIHEGIVDAFAEMENLQGEKWMQPLIVRFTHPSFFGQKVAFYPS